MFGRKKYDRNNANYKSTTDRQYDRFNAISEKNKAFGFGGEFKSLIDYNAFMVDDAGRKVMEAGD